MRLVILTYGTLTEFRFACNCGWISPLHWTIEAAGRDADLHMAAKFPIGTQRRPCEAQR
jgi:hypothetical protein